jgi:hypothetical protein
MESMDLTDKIKEAGKRMEAGKEAIPGSVF